MMSPQEWGDARWISDGHDKDYRPSPYFRKDFEVRRNVKHAYAVIAAAGLYELSVNGSRIGDHFWILCTLISTKGYYRLCMI